MKTIKAFLKPISIFLSLLIFLISCQQYTLNENENNNNKFDYDTYYSLKNEINKGNTFFMNRLMISEVPIEFLELSGLDEKDFMEQYNSYELSEFENILASNFINSIIEENFDIAIDKFEEEVINANLTNEEFNKYNSFAIGLKMLNDEDSSLFLSVEVEQNGGSCLLAIFLHGLATLNLIQCSPQASSPWLCFRAFLAWVLSIVAINEACD